MPRALEPQQTPAFFIHGPSPFARLVLFSTLSLALIVTDSRLHYLNDTRQALMALLHPLQVVANAPFNLYHTSSEYLTAHTTLVETNRRLVEQALHDGAKLQRLNELEVENEHLRSLLGASRAIAQPARMAEILYMGRDPFSQKMVVNLGEHHNIRAGQAVVDGDGVIGQVTRVYPMSSEVTLITDKELSIPIQIERNGLRAIAFGAGIDNVIDLPYLPVNVDVQIGDRLITSGIDGVYPVGLAVAEVTDIERNPDSPFARITSKPVAGVKNHRQVLLISIPEIDSSPGQVIGRQPASDTSPTAVAPETDQAGGRR